MDPRFDPDARDREGAARSLRERAVQARIDGFRADGELEPLVRDGVEWGLRGFARGPDGRRYQTVYVYAPHRGRGLASALLAGGDPPVVTTPDGDLERWLARRGVPFVVVARITATLEYRAIAAHYGARTARRSGVPLVHHIDEGLAILAGRGAGDRAMRAFCLHPLVQADDALAAAYPRLAELTADPQVLALALEYRHIANATLSHRPIAGPGDIPLSPLAEVNEMLVADKIQNRKDFLRHHRASHPRADALDRYFRLWLERLGVSEAEHERWSAALRA
jgi:GNAT superfamily N-acetyltransferase